MNSTNNLGPVIVVFGITGDLSKRKLLPALYHLLSQDKLPADTKIIGVSRHELSASELLSTVELCVLEADKVCDPAGLERVHEALQTIQVDPENPDDFGRLKACLDSFDEQGKRDRLVYLSIPSRAYPPLIHNLGQTGLNDDRTRLLIEKPFGYDTQSAEDLIRLVGDEFNEQQVYRIDHYLAKETAQNLLAFRLHNPIFSPLWSGEHIKSVRVRAIEKIGIEGRSGFYEQTGALRDLVQSHLMQLLAITLMDLPGTMDSSAIHDSKEHFLSQLLPADPSQAARAQYDSYREEVSNPNSNVETYARLRLKSHEARWQDTEFILETGKGLAEKTTDITIEFRTPHEPQRNNLVFQLQPNEGIELDLVVKTPGLENNLQHTQLDFSYQEAFNGLTHSDAYERVLMDALRGDQSLFASDQEVLATWRVLQPVLDAWRGNDAGLQTYAVGSSGPEG